MTDKMSKEEARSVLNEFLSRNHLELVTNVKAYVLKIVESIEPEHKKVVLPKEVGEQWDKLVASQTTDDQGVTTTDYGLTKLVRYNLDGDRFRELVEWWDHTSNSCETLINAAKYGWVPEPEKLYLLPMAGTQGAEARLYACKGLAWIVRAATSDSKAVAMGTTVTQADLEGAPAWVQAIEKKEVSDNGEN